MDVSMPNATQSGWTINRTPLGLGIPGSGSKRDGCDTTKQTIETRASGSLKALCSATILVVSSGFGGGERLSSAPEMIFRALAKTRTLGAQATDSTTASSTLPPITLPESAQVAYLLAHLLSNKSGLADILGISRTALYDWKAGKSVSPENSAHLGRITACVQQVAFGRSGKLYQRYVTERIDAKSQPIAELLKDKAFDQNRVVALLTKAWEMSEEREAKNRALDQRLADQGFSELTEEQRRANAEHNRFMLDLQRGESG